MARSPKRIHTPGRRVGSKELNRLKDHLGKDHGKPPDCGTIADAYMISRSSSINYGTFPSQPGWPIDPEAEKDQTEGGEPLVQSVRAYLANEPHKIVVRVIPEPEPQPQSTDIQIVTDEERPNSSNTPPRRNDLNNNSNRGRLPSPKTAAETPSGETAKPAEPPTMPTASDRMQRQPLLSSKQPSHSIVIEESDVNCADGAHQGGPPYINGDVQLSDLPGRSERYPREILKTVLSLLFLFVCVTINLCSLSLTHERVPDRTKYGPLPDVYLDNISQNDWGLAVSEYIIMITSTSVSILLAMHKYRFIVIRRVFFITGLLYLYRSVTMYVTVLPMSSTTYYCSPKLNHTTPLVIIERIAYLMSGFGLSINGKHTYCGDFIYSGHTTILVLGYLIIAEYSPRKMHLIHWLYFASSFVGVFFLMLAHAHYTVDVVIAYYISTRLFWSYHTLTRVSHQGSTNLMITREWWYRIFLYFEGNVYGPVPRQYDWPLPWPKILIKFFSRLS